MKRTYAGQLSTTADAQQLHWGLVLGLNIPETVGNDGRTGVQVRLYSFKVQIVIRNLSSVAGWVRCMLLQKHKPEIQLGAPGNELFENFGQGIEGDDYSGGGQAGINRGINRRLYTPIFDKKFRFLQGEDVPQRSIALGRNEVNKKFMIPINKTVKFTGNAGTTLANSDVLPNMQWVCFVQWDDGSTTRALDRLSYDSILYFKE